MTTTLTRTHQRRTRHWTVGDILAIVALLVVAAFIVAPSLIAPFDPLQEFPDAPLHGPTTTHWLGTDYLGRDQLSRLVHGTAVTMLGSVIAVVIGLVVGTALGLVSAYFGKVVDTLASRIADVLLSIPTLLLSITIIVALGFGTVNAAIAVGVSTIVVFFRLMRSEVLTVKNLPFVEASEHLGAGNIRILVRHILPNAYSSVLALAALQFGTAILSIAALSFLGYGANPPTPEWGLMISEARNYIHTAPWLIIVPGVAIVVTVSSISRVSHLIRKRVG
ncbi:ABC transporter permease [Rhodococcoides kyotonense]|uniref:Peptide/nickel transport system permease protein n=1 Tax=Rhodococcoides kyotonense TaxID=398843 RepID=A0A239GAF5_9NOCA|nr:ABC transporter permease [Rhodococcus kyotonensis]SNS65433.1 peptide/nickel transport system permease protein [Rhodococcus kyotonensis]